MLGQIIHIVRHYLSPSDYCTLVITCRDAWKIGSGGRFMVLRSLDGSAVVDVRPSDSVVCKPTITTVDNIDYRGVSKIELGSYGGRCELNIPGSWKFLSSVRHVIISLDNSLVPVECIYNLPARLTHLTLGVQGTGLEHVLHQLVNLRCLTLTKGCNLACSRLPDGLRTLRILSFYCSEVIRSDKSQWDLPDGLRYLELGYLFRSTVCIQNAQWTLPSSLKTLIIKRYLGRTLRDSLLEKWMIPPSLIRLETVLGVGGIPSAVRDLHLHIFAEHQEPAFRVRWPTKMKRLLLEASSYNYHGLHPDSIVLPDGLESVAFVNIGSSGVVYPNSIRRIRMEVYCWLELRDQIPACLTHLYLTQTNPDVMNWNVPSYLTHLDLGSQFNKDVLKIYRKKPVEMLKLPETLTHLSLGGQFNQQILTKKGQWRLPTSLQFLRIGSAAPIKPVTLDLVWKWNYGPAYFSSFNQAVMLDTKDGVIFWELPKGLDVLDLGPMFEQPLVMKGVSWPVPREARVIRPLFLLRHAWPELNK